MTALKLSYCVCLAWAGLLSVVFWFGAEPIASVFTDDTKIVNTATRYLQIVPLSVWGYGMVIIGAGGFNAIGKSGTGLTFYLTRTVLLYIPLSFAASMLADSWAVFVGIAIANAVAGAAVAMFSLWRLTRRDDAEAVPA